MTHSGTVLRSGALLIGLGLLAACQAPMEPIDTRSSSERVGAPLTGSGPGMPVTTGGTGGALRSDRTGAALEPAGTGTVGTTGPDTTFGRERQGAPLR